MTLRMAAPGDNALGETLMHPSRDPLRVLFVCSGNSARSQIAEVLLNRKAAGRFVAESAGSDPANQVNPSAIEALLRHGYVWASSRKPRGLDEVLTQDWDFVITVCDRAKEACPNFPGQPVLAHWAMPDPAAVMGTDDEKRRAFDDAVILLNRRLELLLDLPIEKLSRLALVQRTGDIGGQGAGEPPAHG
jgi:arsenate reductase (thioredoxin)